MDGDDERRAKTSGNEPSERSALAEGADTAKPAAAIVASLSNCRRLSFWTGFLGFIPISNVVMGRIEKRQRSRVSHIDLSAHTIAIGCKTESTVAVNAVSPVYQYESLGEPQTEIYPPRVPTGGRGSCRACAAMVRQEPHPPHPPHQPEQ